MSICLHRDIEEGDVVAFEYTEGDGSVGERGEVVDINYEGKATQGAAPRSLVVDADPATAFYISIDKMVVQRQRHTEEARRLLSIRQKTG